MIWFTVDQGAERIHRTPETIRRWLREQRLTSHRNPIDGGTYIPEAELLELERTMRRRQNATRFTASRQHYAEAS